MEIVWGVGESKVLKVSKILGVTPTIISLDTYAVSVKSVQIMSLRRWLNKDGWGTGGR